VILAVSHADDEHAGPVLAALRRLGAEARLIDQADFPRRGGVALGYGGAGEGGALEGPWGSIEASQVTAVWWRRPRDFEASGALASGDAAYAVRQTGEALGGFWASLDARWVNQPWAQLAAGHKPRQLDAARRAGLEVPPTLITNLPARARAFLGAQRGGAVCKALHATPEDWQPTRLVGPGDLERLDEVRFAPVIFQAFVPGVDVRVTAVGERLFAAAIDARETASPADFRPAFAEARVEPCELPPPVAGRLRSLLRDLGLAYAAIDLRRTAAGQHVFLEVNPAGQWLFVEERTGQPIAEALAALLAGRAP